MESASELRSIQLPRNQMLLPEKRHGRLSSANPDVSQAAVNEFVAVPFLLEFVPVESRCIVRVHVFEQSFVCGSDVVN